jgi:signal transduction histidine kinase/ActR/RegA family two-component response regulator
MNCIDQHIDEYQGYILSYARNPSEEILYGCSELGKKLALQQCSVEEVVTLHQSCINDLTALLTDKQVIDSFDLLTEVTVQQTLWLKREIELKFDAQNQISKQLLLEQSIISSFPDGLIKLSADLSIVDCNDHFTNMFPHIRLHVKEDFTNLFQYQNDIHQLVEMSQGAEQRSNKRVNLLSANQQLFPCEVTIVSLKDVNHKNEGFLCIIRDLSEILQTSAQLEFAHQMIDDVIEAMPLRIYWKNTQLQYLGCNNAYLADLGVDEQKSILHKTSEQLKAQFTDIEIASSSMVEQQVITQKIPFHQVERKVILAVQGEIYIKETIHPLRDLQGDIYGIICCYEDITELKNKEKENQRLAHNLNQSQRLDSIGRLAGGIAHDFNNMLSVILGYTQLMERNNGIFSQQDKCLDYLGRVAAAADKAKLLTEKLLTFSRKEVLQPIAIELHAHIKHALTTYASLIGEDIFISLTTERQYWVLADGNQIDQVILNLLVNARDAMIDKHSSEQKRIEIKLTDSDSGDYVLLMVKDTGIGMDNEIRKQIFEPFFTTKKDIGTGLGLANVFGIVAQNKGDIVVNSELGVGTEFVISWPLDKRVKQSIAIDSLEPSVKFNNVNNQSLLICIVEDEEPVRNLMESVISSAGYKVIAVESGKLLFNFLEYSQLVPALLISDVILAHGENGKDVSKKFSQYYPESKVMFVSGYSSDLISKRGIILEGVTYLKKPFDIDKLLVLIQGLLATDNKPSQLDS